EAPKVEVHAEAQLRREGEAPLPGRREAVEARRAIEARVMRAEAGVAGGVEALPESVVLADDAPLAPRHVSPAGLAHKSEPPLGSWVPLRRGQRRRPQRQQHQA